MNILIFNIPRENRLLELKVNRELKAIGAKMLQHSVWKSENLKQLILMATRIKAQGGKASILEEKFIFS